MIKNTHKPSIIALHETHLRVQEERQLSKTLRRRWTSFFVPLARALSGISLSWLHSTLEIKVLSSTSQIIHTIIVMPKVKPWLLSVVYASIIISLEILCGMVRQTPS